MFILKSSCTLTVDDFQFDFDVFRSHPNTRNSATQCDTVTCKQLAG